MNRSDRFKIWTCAAALALTGLPAAAPWRAFAEGNKNAVQRDNKLSPAYLQMPRMAVAVPVKGTDLQRELLVELWVYLPDPKLMVKLTAKRSVIADEIRTKIEKNFAQNYLAPDEGPQLIKEIARDAVEAQIGKDAGEDILIKSMILR